MASITCPTCGTRYVKETKTLTGKKTYKQTFIGDGAGNLRQTHPPKPALPPQIWGSKTGQRIVQTCISCGVVAIITGGNFALTCATAGVVWFGSLVGGSGNWGVIKDLLDFNRDGKLNMADIKHAVNTVLDEVLEDNDTPSLPDIPVQVIRGTETTFGAITGVTQEQLAEAAKVMFSVAHRDKPFARNRVGSIFGSNEEFGRVQKEMIKLKLLEGNDNAGYKLTNEGKIFLSRYHSSPTPPAVE